MSLNAVKTILLASAVVMLGSLADSTEARHVRVSVNHVKKACNKCQSPPDWSKYTGVCYHDRGDHTNWFFRNPSGADFSLCGCCKLDAWDRDNLNGDWKTVDLNDEVDCDVKAGTPSIGDWFWKSTMQC